jgi:inorganic triphosphatase YgiF
LGDEIELKLAVPPSDLAKIWRSRPISRNQIGAKQDVDVVSVYYDTPTRALRRNGISFRLRRYGQNYLQTVKADTGSLARRKEWECEVPGGKPDFKALSGTALEPVFKRKKIRQQLRLVFETHVRRGVIVLAWGQSKIEVSLDRGQIKCGHLRTSISEVELELKEGDPAALFAVANEIAKIAPLRLAALSKAEAGYRLADGERRRSVRSTPIVLSRKATSSEAFREVANSCLRQVVANEESVDAADPEGVHQMRIGLRRLRTAVAFFSKLTQADPKVERIKHNLKWITGQLGPARDIDVYLQKSVKPLERGRQPVVGSHALKETAERRRKAAFLQAREAIRSKRYRNIILDVAEWLNAGAWLTADSVEARGYQQCPVVDFVRYELRRRRKKLAKRKRNFEKADAAKRHKIRISAKKLRYANEFFASIFPGRKAKKQRRVFAKSLKQLQSSLGDLNDFALHDRLADRLTLARQTRARGRRGRRRAFAAGTIAGKEHAQVRPLLKAARRALGDIADGKQYWRK